MNDWYHLQAAEIRLAGELNLELRQSARSSRATGRFEISMQWPICIALSLLSLALVFVVWLAVNHFRGLTYTANKYAGPGEPLVCLLGGENWKSKIVFRRPPTLLLSKPYSFKRSLMQDSLILHGPIEEYPITRRPRTVARLERCGEFPSLAL